jgi:hypothetical protein
VLNTGIFGKSKKEKWEEEKRRIELEVAKEEMLKPKDTFINPTIINEKISKINADIKEAIEGEVTRVVTERKTRKWQSE